MTPAGTLSHNPTRWLPGLSARVPIILQAEAAECGLACLAMVAAFYGNHTGLNDLRERYPVSMRGAGLQTLINIAGGLHLQCRALKLSLADLDRLTRPAILHWDMQHYVVLVDVRGDRVTIHDPALGRRRLSREDASRHFTGIALELSPGRNFEIISPPPGLTLFHFWQRISGLKRSLIILFILSGLLQLAAIASPYYLQTVIDDVLLRQNHDLLLTLALGFVLLLLFETGISVLRKLLILSMSTRLQLQMSANVFRHLIHLPLAYFAKRHTGDLVSRFSSLAYIREFITVGFVTVMLDGLMALLTLIVMALYSPMLTLTVMVTVLLYIVARLALLPLVRRHTNERIASAASEQSHFIESVRAIQPLRRYQQENHRQHQWQNLLVETLNNDVKLGRLDISAATLNQCLFGLENILVVYLAALLVMDNTFTVGMLYAFIAYKSRFTSALDSVVNKLIEYRMLHVHLDRLSDIVLTPVTLPETTLPTDACTPSRQSALRVNNLTFRYGSTEADVFSQIQLDVPPRSTVAIVGASGSGKSTLLKCLMGLYAPTQGQVTFGNLKVSPTWAHARLFASVMQDDVCLNGSIIQNITCFDEQPDINKVVASARLACLHDDIMAMPMQYQTLVGDMGSALSGGQRQRLLLARALYREPAVLFLDEASSQLDTTNEQRINQNLKQLDLTRIIVAHRPQTIAMADVVYELCNGSLVLRTPSAVPGIAETL
ncbi:peptidase domain-containing ABC transporter [Alteromonas sp. CYL-A6]|uniref:peptidase domain-containing ABC transporter n=1 Tax=Alteromonas nitratireducens TaxID=3390813 RepID=UPI0034B659D8